MFTPLSRALLATWCALLCLSASGASSAGVRGHHLRPAHRHARVSDKPAPPVDLELKLLGAAPGQPVRFETVVQAHRPVNDISMDVRVPEGARWISGARELTGKLDAGEQRALPMGVSLPPRGHSEIYVLLHFHLANGSAMTRGAALSFDDGQPSKPLEGRRSQWNGTPVLEFPAQGGSR